MKRECGIDILRIISAIAVVFIHVVSGAVTNSVGMVDEIIAARLELLHNLLKWSVPVFFMITGYCLLKREECTYKYCFGHVLKYASVLLTVGFLQAILEEIFEYRAFDCGVLVRSLQNVVSGELWDHMWYVYSVIGIYLVMPVIYCFIRKSYSDACILTALLFLFTVVCPFAEKYITFGVTLPFGDYLFYVCFGGLIARYGVKKYSFFAFCLLGMLCAAWIVSGTGGYHFGYRSPAVCFIAIAIFMTVSKLPVKEHRFLIKFSRCTWGIYLIHPFFINIAIKVLNVDLLSSFSAIKMVGFAVIIITMSFAATWIVRKIPYIRRLF